MKYNNKISLLVLFLLSSGAIWAQSAGISPQETSDTQLKASFEAEQLSHRQVGVFQQKAEQLVSDFMDYYHLLQDNQLDDDLKREVIKVMSDLFNAPTDTIVLDKAYLVSDLGTLDFSTLPTYQLAQVFAVEVALNRQLSEIELPLAILLKGQSTPSASMAILSRNNKRFGDKTQAVWDVQLKKLNLNGSNH